MGDIPGSHYRRFSYNYLARFSLNLLLFTHRSPRSSGVESVVLNVPQRYQCASNGAIALLLSVVQHVKFQNYWAKDIVFLVSEQDSCGVQAWLGSYHGSNLKGSPHQHLL